MVALLPAAELQFCDANGAPYAGGSLGTYIPATTTPKTTWSESTGTTANSNPIVLDAAGRCIVYGDGIYRTILKDAAGNLIWDQLSNTLVSVAMAPVCIASTIAAAQALLGIVDETAAIATLTSGLAAEAATRAAADSAEATTRATADTTNATAIATETTRALAAEAALGGAGGFPVGQRLQVGDSTTNSVGAVTITFPIPFSGTPRVYLTENSGPSFSGLTAYAQTSANFQVFSAKSFTTGAGLGPVGFNWLAVGPL